MVGHYIKQLQVDYLQEQVIINQEELLDLEINYKIL